MSAPDIPAPMREAVRVRDGDRCRLCGRTDRALSIHHVIFGGDQRGMGGRRVHNPSELVCLCAACHALAHSDKRRWTDLLLKTIASPGTTALQLHRWATRRDLS